VCDALLIISHEIKAVLFGLSRQILIDRALPDKILGRLGCNLLHHLFGLLSLHNKTLLKNHVIIQPPFFKGRGKYSQIYYSMLKYVVHSK